MKIDVILSTEPNKDKNISANQGVINISGDVTIDGADKEITAGSDFVKESKNHMINVTGGTVTIKNLTIVGNESTKHGINVYGAATKVILQNVTIKNCGAAAMVINAGTVVATGLTTSGNSWGAVNVDKGGKLTIDTLAKLGEDAQLWSENNTTSTINVTSGAAKAVGGGTEFNGKDYYSSRNFEGLGVATITKNGTTTVYKELDKAIEAAAAGDTVKLTSDVSDVIVDKNITLDLNGNSTGKLTASGSSKVTVKDSSGDGMINGAITGNVVAVNGSKLVSNGDGGYKLEKVSNNYYYYYPATDTKKDETKGSPKTFDAGVGVYAVTALLSVGGMAWVGKKRG